MIKKIQFLFFAFFVLFLVGCVPMPEIVNHKWTVYFHTNGGSEIKNIEVKHGELIGDITTIKEGYIFTGWYSDSEMTMSFDIDVNFITMEINLYADWEVQTYNVSLNMQGGNGGDEVINVTYNESMPIAKAPIKTEYHFQGYYDDLNIQYYDKNMNSCRNWDKSSDDELYAKWEKNVYIVSLNDNGGYGGSKTVNVSYGEAMPEAVLPQKDGYIFQGYYDDLNIQYYDANMDSVHNWDKTSNGILMASWEKDYSSSVHKLSFQSIAGGYSVGARNKDIDGEIVIPEKYYGLPIIDIKENAFFYCAKVESVVLPSTIKTIGKSAFEGCQNLESINFPEGLKSIGGLAFMHTALRSVVIPGSMTSISHNTFYICESLETVVLHENVKSISSSAFGWCTNLTSINIPNNCVIGEGAFYLCKSLKTIELPNGVQIVGKHIFMDSGLEEIYIPASVTYINEMAFERSKYLKNIIVDPNNKNYKSIDGVLFSIDGKSLIQYPCGKEETSYTIPDGVVNITATAFAYCKNLQDITIPSTVRIIGQSAFMYCISLENIVIPEGVTQIEYATFEKCTNLKTIVLPESLVVIKNYSFGYCTNLESIFISKNVTEMLGAVFADCIDLVVYCEASAIPKGWSSNFIPSSATIIWDYKGE